jgi:hypothetical protein
MMKTTKKRYVRTADRRNAIMGYVTMIRWHVSAGQFTKAIAANDEAVTQKVFSGQTHAAIENWLAKTQQQWTPW